MFPMLHRFLLALERFEDSPLGLALGAAVVFAAPCLILSLNEGGVR